jgi:hypothetical protein
LFFFRLSLNFWIETLYHLVDLSELVIYNPLEIRSLFMLLAMRKNPLKSVTFITNAAASLEKLEESWLKVVEIKLEV